MAELSPMMQQYMQLKSENEDSILLFRLGDFYEMFFDDARLVSEELDLTLTGRDCGLSERAPMCGVPYHSLEAYLGRLVQKGHKVAICEQMEDPAKTKGLVKRDITRIVTPGTVIEDSILDESRNNYLGCVYINEGVIGLCFIDASCGDCHVTEFDLKSGIDRLKNDIMRFNPSEIIIREDDMKALNIPEFFKNVYQGSVSLRPNEHLISDITENLVKRAFVVPSLEMVGLVSGGASALSIGYAVRYVSQNNRGKFVEFKNLDIYSDAKFMRLDITAIRNLELCETLRSKNKKGSLLWVLDKTKTAMGKRLLHNWIIKPLVAPNEIALRQNAVEELCEFTLKRGEICEHLMGVRDIERIITKAAYGTANARDLLSLGATCKVFPLIKSEIADSRCRMLKGIFADIGDFSETVALIDAAIEEDAGLLLKEGGIIKSGFNEEVDRLRDDMNGGTGALSEIENRERERTGIKNLRVKYNKVFGYYIEVTNSYKDLVPEDYIRKQTLKGAERYITEELKQLETRVLGAKDRLFALEYEIFDGVREAVAQKSSELRAAAAAIARLDVLCSLSNVAIENNYTRPIIDQSGVIAIEGGRHPVVEQLLSAPFVANDTYLDSRDDRCAIITGPNMAGKSTYMRQVALIVLMAQIGSFVPAKNARISIVDSIFTRVGASDDLSTGQSTFMVEMSEVADILKNATKNSLLILDEIGRGTSTYDGMSIAKAVLEYVLDKKALGAKALFATHYHELTSMENELSGVKNYNIAAKKRGDDIIFLRKIVRGGADDSYGIEVASLSGIPKKVIDRAKAILSSIEQEGVVTYKAAPISGDLIPLEAQSASAILEELKILDVNTLTPIEAMSVLNDLIKKAKEI